MFERIREFIQGDAPLARDRNGQPASHDLRVATAVLLLEMAYGDEEFEQEEKDVVRDELMIEFAISKREANSIIEEAEGSRPAKGDVQPLIAEINERYNTEQRIEIMAMVWKVVAADGLVAKFEEVYATHLRKLMELSPEQAVMARKLAEQDMAAID